MSQSRRRYPLESWALLFPPPDGIRAGLPPGVHQPVAPAEFRFDLPSGAIPLRDAAEPPVRRRGHSLIAWVIIILLVTLTAGLQYLRQHLAHLLPEETPNEQTGPVLPARGDPIAQALTKLQVRYLIGAHSVVHDSGESFLEQLRTLPAGTIEDQLRNAIYAGELAGPKAALESLKEISDNRSNLTAEQRHLLDILQRLYTDYAGLRFSAPSVLPAQRTLLEENLGWAGELALVPAGASPPNQVEAAAGVGMGVALSKTGAPDPEGREAVLAPARRTFTTMIAGFLGGLFLAFLGLIGLFIMGLLFLNRRVRSQLEIHHGNSGLYAETFALWMVLFIAFAVIRELLIPAAWPTWAAMASAGVAFFLSLSALFWPVVRGIPWNVVRREIGWTSKGNPLVEVLWGFAWYVMSLPLLAIGLILTLVLMLIKSTLENPGGGPGTSSGREAAHPIVGEIALADPATLVIIFLLASVAAPIVEETFFRGVLYRHLREASWKLRGFLSVLLSGGLVSFIFAVIHPQGLLAVPVLMALAFGFTLARESRGSLIPCMVAHGVSNGLVMLASVLMLSG